LEFFGFCSFLLFFVALYFQYALRKSRTEGAEQDRVNTVFTVASAQILFSFPLTPFKIYPTTVAINKSS
jgi:hypothetical protein